MARYRRPLIIGLIVLLCVAIGEFWLYSANRLAGYLHERALGGVAFADLCRSSDIGGFPFRLKVECKSFAAPLRIGPDLVLFGAEEARGEASLFSPNHIIVTLSSPVAMLAAGNAPLAKLRHDGMSLDLAWSLSGLASARLDMKALDWRPESPQAGVAFNLQNLSVRAEPQSGAQSGQGAGALRYELTGEGLTVPALQAVLQKSDPAGFTLIGMVSPPPGAAPDWRASAEDWRQKAGAVTIERFQFRAGDLKLTIDGALALDESHRPAGRLNVKAEGAGPLLTRLGLPAGAARINGVLGALLGKPAEPDAKSDSITLPLTLANGQVFLGPVRLPAAVAPLY